MSTTLHTARSVSCCVFCPHYHYYSLTDLPAMRFPFPSAKKQFCSQQSQMAYEEQGRSYTEQALRELGLLEKHNEVITLQKSHNPFHKLYTKARGFLTRRPRRPKHVPEFQPALFLPVLSPTPECAAVTPTPQDDDVSMSMNASANMNTSVSMNMNTSMSTNANANANMNTSMSISLNATATGEHNEDGNTIDLDMSDVAVLDSLELPSLPSRSPSKLSITKASVLADERRRAKEAKHLIAKEYQFIRQGSNLSQIRRQGSNLSQIRRQGSNISQIRRQGSNSSVTRGKGGASSQVAEPSQALPRTNSSLARAKKYSKRYQAQ